MPPEPDPAQAREDQRNNWSQAVVNWGQLLIALGGLFAAGVSGMFVDRLAQDRRMTIAEASIATIQSDRVREANADAQFKADLSRRLDTIQGSLTNIAVDMARSQAIADRLKALEAIQERDDRARRWQQPRGEDNGRR